jgi:hypothetical protein
MISPIPRSSWKPRSRARPGRLPRAPRPCGPMRIPPSSGPISAPGCRFWDRSPPRGRRTAPTGCGWPKPSSRSAPTRRASKPSSWSGLRRPATSRTSAPATPRRRLMRWPCSAGRCRIASCGGRRWMRSGCRSTCARLPQSGPSMRGCGTSTVSGCWTIPSIPTRPRHGPASSSRRNWQSGSISRRSWRRRGATSPR